MNAELDFIFRKIRLLEDYKEALFVRLYYLGTSTNVIERNEIWITRLSTTNLIDNLEIQLNGLYQNYENARFSIPE